MFVGLRVLSKPSTLQRRTRKYGLPAAFHSEIALENFENVEPSVLILNVATKFSALRGVALF